MVEESPPGQGRRVLVVEDEVLLAMGLEDDLQADGWKVVGPYHDLHSALDGAGSQQFDVAILDVNLNGVMVFPLAERLLERKVPLLFLTGYLPANLPPHLRDVPRLAKPYDSMALARAVSGLC